MIITISDKTLACVKSFKNRNFTFWRLFKLNSDRATKYIYKTNCKSYVNKVGILDQMAKIENDLRSPCKKLVKEKEEIRCFMNFCQSKGKLFP